MGLEFYEGYKIAFNSKGSGWKVCKDCLRECHEENGIMMAKNGVRPHLFRMGGGKPFHLCLDVVEGYYDENFRMKSRRVTYPLCGNIDKEV